MPEGTRKTTAPKAGCSRLLMGPECRHAMRVLGRPHVSAPQTLSALGSCLLLALPVAFLPTLLLLNCNRGAPNEPPLDPHSLVFYPASKSNVMIINIKGLCLKLPLFYSRWHKLIFSLTRTHFYVCVLVQVHVYECMCAWVCEGQETSLSTIPQVLSSWFF